MSCGTETNRHPAVFIPPTLTTADGNGQRHAFAGAQPGSSPGARSQQHAGIAIRSATLVAGALDRRRHPNGRSGRRPDRFARVGLAAVAGRAARRHLGGNRPAEELARGRSEVALEDRHAGHRLVVADRGRRPRLFITGDVEDDLVIFAFDTDGKLLWKVDQRPLLEGVVSRGPGDAARSPTAGSITWAPTGAWSALNPTRAAKSGPSTSSNGSTPRTSTGP